MAADGWARRGVIPEMPVKPWLVYGGRGGGRIYLSGYRSHLRGLDNLCTQQEAVVKNYACKDTK